jgi:hypothetical protein
MPPATLFVKVVRGVGTNDLPRLLREYHQNNGRSTTTDVIEQTEANYSNFLAQTHEKSRRTRFLICALIAGTFALRSSSKTWQAAVVLVIARLTMLSCLGWVALQSLQSSIANHLRVRIETMLSAAVTLSMLLLPPLSLGNLRVSGNLNVGILVRDRTIA